MDTFKILSIIFTVFFVSGEACVSKFKNGTEMFQTNLAQCLTTLKIDPSKIADTLTNPEKDDMCLSKCYLEKFYIVKDGKVDLDAFNAFLEDQAPPALATKLSETVTKCATSSGTEKLGKEKLQPADVCRVIHSFYACFIASSDKLC